MPFSGIHEFSQPDAQLEIAAVFMTVNFAKSLPGLARGEILVIWKTTTSIFPITSAATSPPLKAIAPPKKKLSVTTQCIFGKKTPLASSLAFTRQAFEHIGGWPLTLRGDFDQQRLNWLNTSGPAADPCSVASPSSMLRWGSTGAYHGQALMQGPDDET